MRALFLISGIIFMFSCSLEQKPDYLLEKPSDLLGKEKMAAIIMDAQIKEALVLNMNLKYDSAKMLFKSYYEPQILEKHNVPESTFVKSYQYYISDPSLIKEIYEVVVDSLNSRKTLKKLE